MGKQNGRNNVYNSGQNFIDCTKTIIAFKEETDKSEQQSILTTPKSFNLESEPPQMTEKKQTPFVPQMKKSEKDLSEPENLNETQILTTKRQNLSVNQSSQNYKNASKNLNGLKSEIQKINQNLQQSNSTSHNQTQAHSQSNSMQTLNFQNNPKQLGYILDFNNIAPTYDVIDLTQDNAEQSSPRDYEISSDEERIETFITQDKKRESFQIKRLSYQEQKFDSIDDSVVLDADEFMNKLKDKTVNEIKNQRVQSIIENKNNYFQQKQNDNCAYESVNVRDHEISIMNSGNQTPLEINNLQSISKIHNDKIADDFINYQNIPGVVYECDLTDTVEKKDKVEDYDENYQTKMEQQQNKQLMSSVYNRLYVQAQDLQFKQEFERQFQSYVEKAKYSNVRNTKTHNSHKISYDYDTYADGPKTHRKTCSQSSIKKLYEDYQVRQEKSFQVMEEVERKIREDMNMIKSNKNSHNLALQKLEKDLNSILKHMSRKFFPDDKSNLLPPHIFNPLLYEQNQPDQKAFHEMIQKQYEELKNKRELTLSKRQLQEFFVVIGVMKFINEDIAENLNVKQLEKMNNEIEFLDNIWAIVNIRYDSEIQNQSQTVELEFLLQLFKIIFDPYTSIDQQTHLILELRRIIKNIFIKSQIKINDKLEAYLENQDDIEIFIRQTIDDFRAMYSNFYNIAHLTTLQYNSNSRRSMSPRRRSQSNNRKKYSLISDEQQCVFKPKTNKKSQQLDPFSKKQFLQQILDQQNTHCNSEVIDEDEESISYSKTQNKKTINILNASNISATQQADIQMLNQISLNHNSDHPLFTISGTEVAEQTRDRILSVFQITTSQKNRSSPSRQQFLALGLQGSTNESKHTYIDDITDDQSKTQFNHLQSLNDPQFKLNRNIILYEQGKMHKKRHERFSQSFLEQEQKKYSFKPEINKSRIKSPISFYGDDTINVHERLHLQGEKIEDQKREHIRQIEKSQEKQFKEECTFQPQISTQLRYDKEKVKETTPRGFEKIIKRMKDGQVLKEQKIRDFNNLGQVKNYSGVPTIQSPFELKTSLREKSRQANKRKPFIMIEIIIAPGKIAHLPIYDGDDAHVLCQNFSRTYNLSKVAKDQLHQILINHLQERQRDKQKRLLRQDQQQLNKDLENQYGVKDYSESPLSNYAVRLNYDLENLEHSKIIEVSETNESDNTSRAQEKENLLF